MSKCQASTALRQTDFDSTEQEDPSQYVEGGYHPVKIGDVFNGRYRVVRKLGWGTFSTVWLCRDQQSKRSVAVKVILSELTRSGVAKDEIDTLRHVQNPRLRDPHRDKIIDLLDSFELKGVNGTHTCAVFEVMRSNLLGLVEQNGNKGLPLVQVKEIIRQILQGVNYLHTKCRLIHTDLKPENVLLTTDDESQPKTTANNFRCQQNAAPQATAVRVDNLRIKIADLGCAYRINPKDNVPRYIQTREYRAVEVILGCVMSPAIDIWSVGCIAFELATGDFLFRPEGQGSSKDQNHLLRIVQLLGNIPATLLASGRRSTLFFDRHGRLLHKPCVQPYPLRQMLTERYRWDVQQAREFCDFVLPMLSLNPQRRPTAADCLRHSWLKEQPVGKAERAERPQPARHVPYNLRPRKTITYAEKSH